MNSPTIYWFGALYAAATITVAGLNAAPLTSLPPPFSTNVPGEYLLGRPWVGEKKATVQTGHFATHPDWPELEKFKREMRFDLFTVSYKPSPFNFGSHIISKSDVKTPEGWRHSNLHSYRSDLPTDTAIRGCATVSALTKILGEPHATEAAPFCAAWSFFTVTSTNTIEALSVDCLAEWHGGLINGLEIRRGIAKQSR